MFFASKAPCVGAGALSERIQQMRLNSKMTWGLAWAGLAVVVAVPSMDFLTGKLGDGSNKALITSTTDPVSGAAAPAKTASVTTTITKTGVIITPAGSTPPADPVDKYLDTNKALPSYISGGTAPAAASDTTQVAIVDPVAPTPFPARPAALDRQVIAPAAVTAPQTVAVDPTTTASITTAPVVTAAPSVTTVPVVTAAPAQPVVIVDDSKTATIDGAAPRPPADIVDDSANWKSQGLEQYLDQNGLLDKGKSTANVTSKPADNYDPNGFYLSDGPNNSRAARRARVEQLFDEQDGNAPPASFTLF